MGIYPVRRALIGLFVLFMVCIIFISYYEYDDYYSSFENTRYPPKNKFLVHGANCKIENLDPFNSQAMKFHQPQKYTACSTKELLSFIEKTDDNVTLHIRNQLIKDYSKSGLNCCYSLVTRKSNKTHPDNGIKFSPCKTFKDKVAITDGDVVSVKCTHPKRKNKIIYANVHPIIRTSNKVKDKTKISQNAPGNFSILFIGIDSISRLNLIRSLPKTHQFLQTNDWISLEGYNKIEDNTFPNLMAIFTGFNLTTALAECDPTELGKLDECPMIWHEFERFSYVSAYGEDESWLNTFNFNKKGFRKPPADFYFRPYIMSAETLEIVEKDGMSYCTGPETSGERILNLAKDFSTTFKNNPTFGFFWMNTFSHNEINSPSGMDEKLHDFLYDLTSSRVLENSVVIFLSDHGIRFGQIRYTQSGWMEERLPYIFVSLPEKFRALYPKKVENLKNNAHKLTTPYDLHLTLHDLLKLSNPSHVISRRNQGCPNCQSLFDPINIDRSCEEVAVEPHWCTCLNFKPITLSSTLSMVSAVAASNFVIDQIHKIINNLSKRKNLCFTYSLDKVISASRTEINYKNRTYFFVVFQTKPEAVFEGTVLIKSEHEFALAGGISRLDLYRPHSKCTDDSYLKMYCYCKVT